jgi:hypothetical protein
MASRTNNRIAQTVLLAVWIMLILVEFTFSVSSQTCTGPQYMDPITIQNGSWVPGSQVTVNIDSPFPDDQFNGLKAGNQTWNSTLIVACTGVRFLQFDPIQIQDFNERP